MKSTKIGGILVNYLIDLPLLWLILSKFHLALSLPAAASSRRVFFSTFFVGEYRKGR
jgi:hypothetical protein